MKQQCSHGQIVESVRLCIGIGCIAIAIACAASMRRKRRDRSKRLKESRSILLHAWNTFIDAAPNEGSLLIALQVKLHFIQRIHPHIQTMTNAQRCHHCLSTQRLLQRDPTHTSTAALQLSWRVCQGKARQAQEESDMTFI